MRFKTAVAVSSFVFSSAASAATLYVAPAGHDASAGSIDSPFQTITRAAQVAKPGDVVNVRAGIYSGTTVITSKGTAEAPIVFRSLPGETAILDGTGNASNKAIVDLNRAEYVDFSGFEVRNSPYIGIVVWHGRNVRILDNHIHHTVRNGIYVGGEVTPACFDITVSGNNVHDTVLENQYHTFTGGGWAGAVVVSRTDRSTITGNRIFNNDGEGIISLRSNYAVIRDNEISDSFSVYLYLDNARFTTVDRNLIYSTGNTRYYRDGRPGTGISVANETKDVMNPSSDNVFTNNIVIGTRWGFYYGAYESGGGLRNSRILNNTFYGTTETIIRIEDDTHSNSIVANNIFYQTGSPAPTRGGQGLVTYQSNLWYGGTAGAAAGTDDIIANPQLASAGGFAAANYKLTSFSPALGKGIATPVVTGDFWGTPRAALFDVGAHQYTASSSPPADTTAPTTPAGLSVTASTTAASISLRWSASSDDAGVTSYRIVRNGTLAATVTDTSWTDSGLAWSTPYSYSIIAMDLAGNVSAAAGGTATTIADPAIVAPPPPPPADSVAPTAPTGFWVSPSSSSTRMYLGWTASSDNTAVTAYRIYRDGTHVATVTDTAWTDDSGLKRKTTYSYGVSAIDAAGNESAQGLESARTNK
jgi:parallel beta-helix repeat protein